MIGLRTTGERRHLETGYNYNRLMSTMKIVDAESGAVPFYFSASTSLAPYSAESFGKGSFQI
jgi:hypothetical protein